MEDLRTQIVAFEYQEESGTFHYNIGENLENTNGYHTIAHSTYPLWDEFKILVNAAFKEEVDYDGASGYYRWKNEKYPSFDEIKRLWDAFIKVRETMLNNDQL